MADGAQSEDLKDKPDASAAPAGTDTPAEKQPDATAAPADGAPKGDEKQGADATPKTALEAAKAVIAKGAKDAAANTPQDGEQPPAKAAADKPKEGEAKQPGDEEEPNVPANVKNHPAYREKASKVRILEVAKAKNEQAIKDLEPKAKVYEDLNLFIKESHLSSEDFKQGLTIMRALNTDPHAAYELLKPVMANLESMIGVVLPKDLENDVEAGTMSRERAQELARARADAALAHKRAQTVETRVAQDAAERAKGEEERALQDVVGALDAVEAEWLKSDPDAKKLLRIVQNIVLVDGGVNPPRNAVEARELYREAVKKAKEQVRGFVPSPTPKDGNLPVSGPPTNTAPVPKSSIEAARAALGQG